VQAEIDKAIKPRVWLKSGGYLVINQTEALVSIDVNTGKFVGRGATRLEDTITRTEHGSGRGNCADRFACAISAASSCST
jgi:Rne/Rng family ribonuclease